MGVGGMSRRAAMAQEFGTRPGSRHRPARSGSRYARSDGGLSAGRMRRAPRLPRMREINVGRLLLVGLWELTWLGGRALVWTLTVVLALAIAATTKTAKFSWKHGRPAVAKTARWSAHHTRRGTGRAAGWAASRWQTRRPRTARALGCLRRLGRPPPHPPGRRPDAGNPSASGKTGAVSSLAADGGEWP